MPSLRLMSVNARTAGADRHGVARLIGDARPDVAVVHGAPSLARWRSTCAALARESGLVVVTGGRTAGGNLILSTLGVDVDAVRDLVLPGHHGPRPPGAALALLRLRGRPFAVAAARFAPAGHVGDVAGEAATALAAGAPTIWSVDPDGLVLPPELDVIDRPSPQLIELALR